ncbi:beta-ketoacyl synthase N-terminal-like domain-containing protein [Streptomyces sp. NPDC006743]|uniref:type I polyketide synthase n=1 Tax=Streptomyces sp. NPDC006743 TaxID=3154480 RepID=UPI003453C655
MGSGHGDGASIAVVGMGCRFPQAASVDEYWSNLVGNVDAVTPVPAERFDIAQRYARTPKTPGRTTSRHGGFVPDAFSFDTAFFGISPAEAASIDPQHRLLLLVVREALDAAGIPAPRLAGSRSGVFIGQATADYAHRADLDTHCLREATGSHFRAMAAGRISYDLDLRGPSVMVDTACSSSLVAVHMARQSLLTGETDLAVAGGVNVILSPQDAIAFSSAGMLSPDGRCAFGDLSANGFVRSEGVGVVVLKRLSDARRDGDPVLALLPGSSVTNDGRGSGSLIKPAVAGQTAMIREAWASAGVRPDQLDYVEAHGTGTPVGDAVELQALADMVRGRRGTRGPLPIGSVKSNIGHAEAAAGIAGLIKAVLMIRHRTVPASLHLRDPQPLLAEADSPLEVVTRNRELDVAGDGALVGVSSFGLSGTNAHMVVAEAPARPAEPPRAPAELPAGRPAHLLVLSAHSAPALRRLAAAYADFLAPGGPGRDLPLWDVCATAAQKRQAHPYRLWATGAGHDELAEALRALAQGRPTRAGGLGEAGFDGPRRTVFVFPGQGSQWSGMGRSLKATTPAYARELAACDALVREETGWSVEEVLAAAGGPFPDRVATVQPVLWATELALAAVWRDMGVDPEVCLGHSMGETAAAAVAGALTPADAAAVICRRSALMQRVAGQGAMMAVELSAEQAEDVAAAEGRDVCVAAQNAPTSTVLAGGTRTLRRIARRLAEEGVFHRLVRVDVASHSPFMDPLREDLLERLSGLKPARGTTALYSSLLGAFVDGPELDAGYWMDNLRRPVRFADSVRHLAKDADNVFVEISPHPVLLNAVTDTLADAGHTPAVVASTDRTRTDEALALAQSLGAFFTLGGTVDWQRWFRGPARQVPLPAYPFEREPLRRAVPVAAPAAPPAARHTTVDLAADLSGAAVRLRGLAPLPPAVQLAALREAVRPAAGTAPAVTIENIRLGGELVEIPARGSLTLRVRTEERSGDTAGDRPGARPAEVRALDGTTEGPGTLCMTATVATAPSRPAPSGRARLDAALGRCRTHRTPQEFFTRLARRGYEPSPAMRAVRHVWRRDGESVALLHRPDGVPAQAAWEAALLPLLAALPGSLPPASAYRVTHLERVRFHADLPEEFWLHTTLRVREAGERLRADATLLDQQGRALAEFQGMELRRLGAARPVGAYVRAAVDLPRRAAVRAGGAVRTLRAALASRWLPGAPSRTAGPLGNRPAHEVPPAYEVPSAHEVPSACEVPSVYEVPAAREVPPAHRPAGRDIPPARATHPPYGAPATASAAPAAPAPAPVATVPAAPAAATPVASAPAPSAVTTAPPAPDRRFVEIVAELLGMDTERLDVRRRLSAYGFDSLTAVQLRGRVRSELGCDIPLSRLLGRDSVKTLALSLAGAVAGG